MPAPQYNQSGFPTINEQGLITAYHPQYGKYYAGQPLSSVESMLGEENKRRGLITQGADFTGAKNSLSSLMADPSRITQDPSYQFRLDQGNQAINRGAAAKGMLGSGNVLAELAKFGQGMASEEYGNQFNRLSDLMNRQKQFGISSGYFKQPENQIPQNLMLGGSQQQSTNTGWPSPSNW